MEGREFYEHMTPEDEEAWLRELAAVRVPQPTGNGICGTGSAPAAANKPTVKPEAVEAAIHILERVNNIKKARARGHIVQEEDWGEEADAVALLTNLDNENEEQNVYPQQTSLERISGVIVVGGFTVANDQVARQTPIVYRITPYSFLCSSFWSATLPSGLYTGESFATCVATNSLYFSGGNDAGNSFACYDPISNTWTELPNMPTGRRHHSIASFGSHVFAIGGVSLEGELQDKIDFFDVSTMAWYQTSCRLCPVLKNVSSVALSNCVCIFGSTLEDSDGHCVVQRLEMVGTELHIRSGFHPLYFKAKDITPLRNGNSLYIMDRASGVVCNMWVPREGDSVLMRKLKGQVTGHRQVQCTLLCENELITFGQGGQKEQIGNFNRKAFTFPPPLNFQAQVLSFPRHHFLSLADQQPPASYCHDDRVPTRAIQLSISDIPDLEDKDLQEAMMLSLQESTIGEAGALTHTPTGDELEAFGAVGGVPADNPLAYLGGNYAALAALVEGNDEMAIASLKAACSGMNPSEAQELVHRCREKDLKVDIMSEEDQLKLAILLSCMPQGKPAMHMEEEVEDVDFHFDYGSSDGNDSEGNEVEMSADEIDDITGRSGKPDGGAIDKTWGAVEEQ